MPSPSTVDLEQALAQLRAPGTDRIPLEDVEDRFGLTCSEVKSLLQPAVDAGRVEWDSERETYSSLDAALDRLRESLLYGRPPVLGFHQGDEAFQQHKLLASAVHRASRLDQRNSESETDAWVRYMLDHFPRGRNDSTDAKLLFEEWRCHLLKDSVPGPAVVITHGQSVVHWKRDETGRLCVNLEDMRADYERSVDHFVEYLRFTPDRLAVVLRRSRERAWDVMPLVFTDASVLPVSGATAMGSASVGLQPK